MYSGNLPYDGDGLPLPVKQKDWMAIWHIYGDESGKFSANADRISFCGYVAHINAWQVFAAAWNDCRHKWQVPPIHMARIMFPDNKDDEWKKVRQDWGSAWESKRDLLLKQLSELVFDSHIVCVGAVVDSKHFRSICDTNQTFKKAHRDPVHMAFHTFVMRAIDSVETTDKCSSIGIVIDNDKEFAVKCYQQLEDLKSLAEHDQKFARVKERVHAISFVNDASYPGVQAADMIAYEARRAMVERMENPNYTSELFDNLTFGRTHQPQFWTPEVLDRLNEQLKKDVADGKITV